MPPFLGSALAALLVLAGLLLLAIRQDHLLVMYWYRRGYFLFEATGGGRYRLISPARVPLALAAYAAQLAVAARVAVSRRATAFVHRLLPRAAQAG